MIRGRTIYVVALIAIVSSLIISGCVTAPPKAAPTPAATPMPTTPMPTPSPTPAYSVEVLNAPATAVASQSFAVSWRVNSPVQMNIQHTAVHYGPNSKSEPLALTSYPSLTTPQSGAIPADFSANITIGKTGIIYFRAHAIIDGKNYWSDEKTINITIPITVSTAIQTPKPMATTSGGYSGYY